MNPQALKNNQELYDYLVRLSRNLHQQGALELAKATEHAARFASGSASEFLHEAELVLLRVKQEHREATSGSEASDVESVLEQIREAFRKIGGA